jgi:hypothetical protein
MRPEFEEEFEYELGEFAASRGADWGREYEIGGRRRDLSAPNRPLTLWTIRGFPPNGFTLNQSQLAEIGLIARGLARNPRTRSGMPVLTISGGFAPGENASVANRRAIAVKGALVDTLKQIDLSLLASVGFDLAAEPEPRGSEVAIGFRERIAPPPAPPDLRRVPMDQPRNPMAPPGTQLPPLPTAGPSSGDSLRDRIDSILKDKGMKSKAARDSTVYQIEQAIKSVLGKGGVDFPESPSTPAP